MIGILWFTLLQTFGFFVWLLLANSWGFQSHGAVVAVWIIEGAIVVISIVISAIERR